MATFPQLVDAVAKVDGRDFLTIQNYARIIRDAGQIPTGKRGAGSPQMTISAGANLIIALNVPCMAKESPLYVERYRLLEANGVSSIQPSANILQPFDACNTFGEALEKLIHEAPDILASFKIYVDEQYARVPTRLRYKKLLEGEFAYVRVEFHRYFAAITVGRQQGNPDESIEFYRSPHIEYPGEGYTDRRVVSSFGIMTLVGVALNTLPAANAESFRVFLEEMTGNNASV
jgi:hypothetical protein